MGRLVDTPLADRLLGKQTMKLDKQIRRTQVAFKMGAEAARHVIVENLLMDLEELGLCATCETAVREMIEKERPAG